MIAPTATMIEEMAERALETIPAELRQHVTNLVVRVEDLCDEETEAEMGLETPYDLLGLYRGVDIAHKNVSDPVPQGPDMVFLYRLAILDYWIESGEELEGIVRHVLIHEIGHHFGFSDDDMDRIEGMA